MKFVCPVCGREVIDGGEWARYGGDIWYHKEGKEKWEIGDNLWFDHMRDLDESEPDNDAETIARDILGGTVESILVFEKEEVEPPIKVEIIEVDK